MKYIKGDWGLGPIPNPHFRTLNINLIIKLFKSNK